MYIPYYILLLIENHRRLTIHQDFLARYMTESLLIDDTTATCHGVIALRDSHLCSLLIEIIDYDDILPRVNAFQIFELETYKAILLLALDIHTRQELQVFTHLIACTKSEGRMIFAQLDEMFIIYEHLWITL